MNKVSVLVLVVLTTLFISGCFGESKPELTAQEKKLQQLDNEKYNMLVQKYYKQKIPFGEFSTIGQPETLEGTNNDIWVVYFPEGDFTLVSDKSTDIVRTVHTGRHPYTRN